MNAIMNELRQNVISAETNLRNLASEQISSRKEDGPEYQMTMRNIGIVKQVQDILGNIEETNNAETPKNNVATTLTMNSDLRNKKIASMTIANDTYNIKSLKDIAIGIGDHLVKTDYQNLVSNEKDFVSSVTGKAFASTKKANVECENPAEIKYGKRAFYMDTTRALANNMTLLKKMTTSSGLNLNDIKFATAE